MTQPAERTFDATRFDFTSAATVCKAKKDVTIESKSPVLKPHCPRNAWSCEKNGAQPTLCGTVRHKSDIDEYDL